MVSLLQHQYIMEMKYGGGVMMWERKKSRKSLHCYSAYRFGPFYLYSVGSSLLSQLSLKTERDNRNNLGHLLPLPFIRDEKMRPRGIRYLEAVQLNAFLMSLGGQLCQPCHGSHQWSCSPQLHGYSFQLCSLCFACLWEKKIQINQSQNLRAKKNLRCPLN